MSMFSYNAVEADIPIETGVVQFKVMKVEQDTVKSEGDNFGEQMMVAHVVLKDKKGNTKLLKKYFILNDEYIRNLAYFCQSIGIYEKYKTGQLAESDLIGKVGKCEIERVDQEVNGKEVKVVRIVKFIKKNES
ncbi:hypothetical protein [Fangia hongkongensis]|uniref:hypothetical protein n=1 Tax=Fangia hongkongensis TaxID=270495 RepID=UPI00039C79BF|nr:hypothetical protein [Fangia hongkongensis]MBK2124457.1 hypothetical protein [Fangia hongkongensis]